MEETALVFVEIKSTPALSQRLKDNLESLSNKVEHQGIPAEIGEPPPGGLRAIDPDTLGLLIAIGKSAAGAVASKIAVDLYTWLREQIQAMAETDRPSTVMLTVESTPVELPTLPSRDEIAKAEIRVEQAIKTAAMNT